MVLFKNIKSNHQRMQPIVPLEKCLAKTRLTKLGDKTSGRTVEDHCRIAGAVAALLTERLNLLFPDLLPQDAFIPALTHDVGKVCPTFQAKIYQALDDQQRKYIEALSQVDISMESQWGGHAAVSKACLLGMGAPESLASIVGAHHDRPTRAMSETCSSFGGDAWQKVREALCSKLLRGLSWPDFPAVFTRSLLGLTITADWIASGPLFDDPAEDWRPLVEKAVDDAGFRWPDLRHGLSFENIFSFSPRPAQKALYESISSPGVYILEAPMGAGKTEAALYAAYRMLESRKSTGIYFALPTQLTSNRIYDRVNKFLKRILQEERQALLVHSMAWLERFSRQIMGQDAAPDQSWFASSRRGILAPFGVGTIDQALLSALHVRFGSLRTFGLTGKTVILDEVHSYDTYTGTILDTLIKQLRRLNCTIIILSATLTSERRSALLDYSTASSCYPLITSAPNDREIKELSCLVCSSPLTVNIIHTSAEEAIEEALEKAEQGERVLWIENTVREAQETYRTIAARASAMETLSTGLLHSRFTQTDRASHEKEWTDFFHPQASGRGQKGGIVVGTQVVEQSLDLDADLIICRFCPTDMMLQRLGRLWRHGDRTHRPAGTTPKALLLHPPFGEAASSPKTAFGKSGSVYAPYVLYRSLELWHTRESVRLPDDICQLVEETYSERDDVGQAILSAKRELETIKNELRLHALHGQSTSITPPNDTDIQTRWLKYEEDTVILYKNFDTQTKIVTLADDSSVTLSVPAGAGDQQERLTHWKKRQEIAASLLRNAVRIPHIPGLQLPSWLSPWVYKDMRALQLADDGQLFDNHGNIIEKLFYSHKLGLMIKK